MNKSELIEKLEGVPGDAIVYVMCDHAQVSMQAGYVDYSDCSGRDLPHGDVDGVIFMHPDDRGYDVPPQAATCILIF